MCVLRHTCHPAPCAPQAHPEGNPRIGHPHGPSLRSAPSRGRKRHALRRRGRAQQWPVWLFGCWMFGCPTPCWLRLRRGGCGVRRGTRFAAAQRRSDNHGDSVHEARALRRACHPTTAPPQAQPAGVGSRTSKQPDIHSGHRCARPSLRSAWRLRPRDGAERSAAKQWPVWMSLGFPSGCAWGAQGAGWRVCRRTHALRELTHRSCLSGAPQARSEFCGAPRDRAPQVAPQRSEGVADSRVAFSLVTFFWRSKRKPLRRRAHTPASALNPGTPSKPARRGFESFNPNG